MPYFVLAVLNNFGTFAVFVMLASVLLALCLLTLAFGPETRGKTLEDVELEIQGADSIMSDPTHANVS